jgi:deoxyadenosine/deoxycytidine kinase
MSTRDFENYSILFKMVSSLLQPPDLLLYLRASVPTLVNQIQTRGREYESSIRIDYLKRLNERYEAWIETYNLGKVLIIEADHYNFPNNNDHLSEIIDKINAELHGLF